MIRALGGSEQNLRLRVWRCGGAWHRFQSFAHELKMGLCEWRKSARAYQSTDDRGSGRGPQYGGGVPLAARSLLQYGITPIDSAKTDVTMRFYVENKL